MNVQDLKDNTIIVTNYSNKIHLLKQLNESSKLINIKFLSKEELMKKIFFTYDENAIYYLMTNYKFNREVAGIYLKNLYYITGVSYDNEKLDTLVKIKKDLESNNLLIKDDLFLDYVKNKNIVFYNYNSFSKLEQSVIDILKEYANVEIVSREGSLYNHSVYEFNSISYEIEFVAKEISKLIDKGVAIDKIKITNVDSDYYDIMHRIFSHYGLRVNFNDSKLISTQIVNDFLSMSDSLQNRIELLSSKYKNNKVLEQIIRIVNKYIDFDDFDIVKEMLVYDFKNTYLNNDVYFNTIEIIDYLEDYVDDDTYVFMFSFNQNKVPIIYKDEEFITDNIKANLLLDSTIVKNKRQKEDTINSISRIKNLVITYKCSSPNGVYYPSNLISDLNLNVIRDAFDYQTSYSVVADKINLSKYLDIYFKTGGLSDDLRLLYNSYDDVEYNTYDNRYSRIDESNFKNYINKSFNLSYSSMDSFYKCPFRYYLSHVLKLDIYEERFEAYIGSLFHYVLERALKEKKSIDDLVKVFISTNERVLTKKEKFFVNKLSRELNFIYDTIVDQLDSSNLKNMLFEERVEVIKNGDISVTFKGFIDKIMYEKKDNSTIIAIIDYKTGHTDINLGYLPYGLSMQLPIYLYLAKNSNKLKNVKFAGFYLQRILSGPFKLNPKKSIKDQKRESLLLYGYSNSDEMLLHEFDNTYKDSRFIKSMKLLKNGEFNRYSKVLSDEEIDKLIVQTDKKIDEAIEKITSCAFDIRPKKTEKELLGCKFCSYNDICFKENRDELLIKEDKDLSYLRSDVNA